MRAIVSPLVRSMRANGIQQMSPDFSRYRGGASDYSSVVINQTIVLSNERQATAIAGRRLAASVLLIEGSAEAGAADRCEALLKESALPIPTTLKSSRQRLEEARAVLASIEASAMESMVSILRRSST